MREVFLGVEGAEGVELGLGDVVGDVVGDAVGDAVGDVVGVGEVGGSTGGVASWDTITE